MVVLLVGVVGTIFAASMINAMGVDRRTKDRAAVTASLSVANERITREIRTASPIISVAPSQLVLESWTNGQRRRHTFAYVSGSSELRHTVAEYSSATAVSPFATSTQVIARQVNVPPGTKVFVGRARDGTETTDPSKIASVTVTLVGQPAETSSVPVSTTIFLRNYQG